MFPKTCSSCVNTYFENNVYFRPFVEARATYHGINMFDEIGEKLYFLTSQCFIDKQAVS